jgi:hypothetical protein
MNLEYHRSDNPSPFWFTSREPHKQDLFTGQIPAFASTEEESMLCADLKDSVAFEIGYSVPDVQAVFVSFKENRVLHVWSVVPIYDRCVYRSIYAHEKTIIDQFEGVDFDFNVVASNGKDPRHLMSDPEVDLAFLRK